MKFDKAFIPGSLVMSLFAGIVILSIGVGTDITSLNTAMAPLVCPGYKIIPAWRYDGPQDLADGPALRTRWICVNNSTGEAHIAGYRTIFTAGTVYGLLIWGIAIVGTQRANRKTQNP